MTYPAIEALLPAFMQRGAEANPELRALLASVAGLLAPMEQSFATLDVHFDPRRTDERFVPFLAAWVDLRRVFEVSSELNASGQQQPSSVGVIGGSLRELAAEAAFLSQWRGTERGLVRFLELATGSRGFVVDSRPRDAEGRLRPFHVVIEAPHSAQVWRGLVEKIVAMEKPAHVTAEIVWKVE
jgi:phage tail-like protein